MATIQTEQQSLTPSGIVSLFTLDATSLGGPVMNFVQATKHKSLVKFGGVEYQPIDVEFSGLETSGQGALPTPTIRMANTDGIPQAMVNTWGDLTGCPLTRVRTHVRFLDGEPDADPSAAYPADFFRIERKSSENNVYIEWELSTSIDQEGKMIPGRTIIRETCLWRYRYFDVSKGKFDYSKAQCPYAGNKYFDINDREVSDPADDVPSRRLNCCKTRFGEGAALPFGGFPGVRRTQ